MLTAPEGEGSELLRGEELYKRLQEHGTFAQVNIGYFLISLLGQAVLFQYTEQSFQAHFHMLKGSS